MFERDVPYIFNEIIIGLDTAGRDHLNRVRLSINRVWNQDGSESGLRYFNNIAIYQRDNGNTTYTRRALYDIAGGTGMLQPFIGSVPLFQKESTPTVPSVQNSQ
jgi:hypothetical protein